jgi:hypothetical protein
MAARGSKVRSNSRGATTGQGAKVQREGQAPLPSVKVHVPAIESLDEIGGWLGTFRERMRMARGVEPPEVAAEPA